jgi:anti-sigma-K factor RskA
MLEAYALGAVEPEDGAHIEEHLGECLACWDHLSQSQRAAALLALAVPLEEPREGLRQRIIVQAQQEAEFAPDRSPARRGWRLPRVVAVGATAVVLAAVGALSWSLVETRNLRSDYDDLQQQAVVAGARADDATKLVSIVSHPDVASAEMAGSGLAAGATAYYVWTRSGKVGAIVCEDLPDAPKGKVYQFWFSCPDPVDGGTFTTRQGQCQHIVSLKCTSPLSGINVSVEPEGGSPNPSNEIVLTASFTR